MKSLRLVSRCGILLARGVVYFLKLALRLARLRATGKNHLKNAAKGEVLAQFCEAADGAFLKIGQILSTRFDLLPEETALALQRLQDGVRPLDSSKIPKIIESGLRRKLEDVFINFDFKPVACASIAQVHRAQLKSDGSRVAVKILRPHIKRQYDEDLFLISLGARLLKRLPGFKMIPLEESFRQIADSLSQQTDFLREADNNRRFRAVSFRQPLTKFPRLFEEFCTTEILTMEYFDDLIKINEPVIDSDEREKTIVQCLEVLYQMIFVEGFVHCDLHPGNFFLSGTNHLAILDTGFTADLTENTRLAFREFFGRIVFKDAAACARVIIETAQWRAGEFNHADFENEVAAMLDKVSNLPAKHFQISRFVLGVFEIQRKYGLYSTPDFTLPILSLLVYEGSIKKYAPDLNFQKIAVPYLTMPAKKSSQPE